MRLGVGSVLGWKALGATLFAGALAVSAITGASAQVNHAPTALPDNVATPEDTPIVVSVLANDSDPDAGAVLNIVAVGAPANGTAVLNANKTVTYTPKANFNGVDFFTYAISDGALTASATVVVTVAPVNDAPVAKPDAATLVVNTSKGLDVLANDVDVDGTALTIVAVSQPAHGTAVLNANKTITYTPVANYVGADTFTYTVSDGQLTASTTVSITVKAAGSTGGGNVAAEVKAACKQRGLESNVRTLCRIYLGGKLPAGAQAAIGQVILRRAAQPLKASAICSQSGLEVSVQQLCSVYSDGSVSKYVRHAVGKIIERSVRI